MWGEGNVEMEKQKGYLTVVVFGDENVLGLDIAMHDVPMVEIVDHFQHVLHQRPRLHLVVSPQLDDSVEEIAARHEFHDYV